MIDSEEDTTFPNSQFEQELRRSQYEQAWQRLRHLQSMVWQIPSVTAAIDGGLILVAFRYIRDPWVRISLVLIGLLLSGAMFVALVKHRYFAKSTLATIVAMENEYDLKHVQVTTNGIFSNYWNKTTSNYHLEQQSAARILTLSMIGSIIILFAILCYALIDLTAV